MLRQIAEEMVRHSPGAATHTVRCPCGASFTWSGRGGRALDDWCSVHEGHHREAHSP